MTGNMEVAPHDGPHLLSGSEKVAALLLALDRDLAQRVLKHFDQAELRKIAKCAAGLGTISANSVDPLILEFTNQLFADGPDLIGTAGEAENLIEGVVPPDQLADIMSHVLGSSNKTFWERLARLDETAIAEYLRGEHPQTIAVIVRHVDASFAAKILGTFPSSLRNDVIRRALVGKSVSDFALRIIELTLQENLMANPTAVASPAANAKIAGILNRMERHQIEDLLRDISQAEPAMAEELKARLFTFEDIPRLTYRARTTVFDQVPADQLILALRGVDGELRDAILLSVSSRMRRMIEAELLVEEAPNRRDVMRARRDIADLVLSLADEGVIELIADDERALEESL
jgi:flagellar motor switch protein FliG